MGLTVPGFQPQLRHAIFKLEWIHMCSFGGVTPSVARLVLLVTPVSENVHPSESEMKWEIRVCFGHVTVSPHVLPVGSLPPTGSRGRTRTWVQWPGPPVQAAFCLWCAREGTQCVPALAGSTATRGARVAPPGGIFKGNLD